MSNTVDFVRTTINLNEIELNSLELTTTNMQSFNEFVGDTMTVSSDNEIQFLDGFKEKLHGYIKETAKINGPYMIKCIIDAIKSKINDRKDDCTRIVINLSSLLPVEACAIHALIDVYMNSGECALPEYIESTHITHDASHLKNGILVIIPSADAHKGKTSAIKLHELLDESVYEIVIDRKLTSGFITHNLHPTMHYLEHLIINHATSGFFNVAHAVSYGNSTDKIMPTLREYNLPYIERLQHFITCQ